MKKSLLMLAAIAFTLNASAQFTAAEQVSAPQVASSTRQVASVAEVVKKAPRKSAANGVIYTRPEGTFYLSWTKEGGGYYQSFLMCPPLTGIYFEDASTVEGDRVWSINGTEYDAEEDGRFYFGQLAIHNPYDGYDGVRYFNMPTLTIGDVSYTLAGQNENKNSAYQSYGSGMVVDTLSCFTLLDNHNVTYYGWGAMSPTPYLFGSGVLDGTEYPCVGVFLDYPKPAAPLFIQDAYIQALSNLEVPIPEGKELTLRFVELDEEGNETDNILAEMTATSESVVWQNTREDENFTEGTGNMGIVVFEQKTKDVFGQESITPLIVDVPFRVYLLGLDQEGVDLGFYGRLLGDEAWVGKSYFMIDTGNGVRNYSYNSGISLPITFTAMYDVAILQDSDEGIYTAPVDGGTVTRANNTDYDAAYVYTAYPWYDNQANENYFIYIEYADGDPEWLTTSVDDSYYNQTDSYERFYAVNLINMEAEALPAGVKGRSATVFVYGPAAEVSFVVNQGEVEEDGIISLENDAAKMTNAVYNVAGQQVNNQFKGIVIENGKKVVR